VIAEEFGIPLPAVPALLGVGALAATGRVSMLLTLSAIAVVALCVDFAWYEPGRRRGVPVLARLCRLSLEPDSCVHRAENVFAHDGAPAMLVAKFVPGLTTVVPPLAGIFAIGRARSMKSEACCSGLAPGWDWDTSSAKRSHRLLSAPPGWAACWVSWRWPVVTSS
jgi:hypothetical protein